MTTLYTITKQLPITCVVLCKNEEKHLRFCLESLFFAKEIIVVDSGSSDRSLEIAKSFTNTKIIEHSWEGFCENKQIAINNATYSWIFWIDADEVVTKELQDYLLKEFLELEKNPQLGGFSIFRKAYFLNQWVAHSGWYPNKVLRLFHKNRGALDQVSLHETVILKKGFIEREIPYHLEHFSYLSLYQYFLKMNQYGLSGAKKLLEQNKKTSTLEMFFRPIWTFIRFYIFKKGFKDGSVGFIVCMGAAFSNFIKYTNLYYLQTLGTTEVSRK